MAENELKSLITLLDDPDSEIFNHVAGKLLSMGNNIVPELENVWQETIDPLLQQRIEIIIQKINFYSLETDFKDWLAQDEPSLFDGAILLTRIKYFDIDVSTLRNYVDLIKRAIWIELNHHFSPHEQINVFNHVFYSLKGYSGIQTHRPETYFLNKVIENKSGNAVSLGILYQILAQELDIPVYGINLPKHYVLAYCKTFYSNDEMNYDLQKEVLFYINPVIKGTLFGRNEIKSYLEKIKLEETPSCFKPCSPKETIKIALNYLLLSYLEEKNKDKIEEIKQIIALF